MWPPGRTTYTANPLIACSTADPASYTESANACINGGITARANSHWRSVASSYANPHPYAAPNPLADRNVASAGSDTSPTG